jgi:hypothetical protein
MIHPQYIIALTDVNQCRFKYINGHFEFNIYLNDIKVLYKIKKRFKTGKVIELDDTLVLKITKQLETVIEFYRKNKINNIQQVVTFHRWAYLYQKLIIEKDTKKNRKEQRRIEKRLNFFISKHMI